MSAKALDTSPGRLSWLACGLTATRTGGPLSVAPGEPTDAPTALAPPPLSDENMENVLGNWLGFVLAATPTWLIPGNLKVNFYTRLH